MIRVKIKIGTGSGNPVYADETYGLVYLSSDNRVGAPTKGFEKTSYPEQEGEHILPRTVDAPFDYKVKFFIQASSLSSANDKIKAFNDAVLPLNLQTGEREAQLVALYNSHKRVKIVGYVEKPIEEATEYWRDPSSQVNDVVVCELVIRVPNPSACDFAYTESNN